MLADPTKLVSTETATGFQPNGIKPELGYPVFSLHVNVWMFVPVPGVYEEAVGTLPEQGRHKPILQHSPTRRMASLRLPNGLEMSRPASQD